VSKSAFVSRYTMRSSYSILSPSALQVPGRCWKIESVSIVLVKPVAQARYTFRDSSRLCSANLFSSSDSYRHAILSLVLLEE